MILSPLPSTAVYVPGRRGRHTYGNGVFFSIVKNQCRISHNQIGGFPLNHLIAIQNDPTEILIYSLQFAGLARMSYIVDCLKLRMHILREPGGDSN